MLWSSGAGTASVAMRLYSPSASTSAESVAFVLTSELTRNAPAPGLRSSPLNAP